MDRSKFKKALNELDSNQRTALIYLEELINEKRKPVTPIILPKPNLSEIENKITSMTLQIDSLRDAVKTQSELKKTMIKMELLLEKGFKTIKNDVEQVEFFYEEIVKMLQKNNLIKTIGKDGSIIFAPDSIPTMTRDDIRGMYKKRKDEMQKWENPKEES